MIGIIFALVIIGVSIVVLLVLALRKLPYLRAVDIASLPQAKVKELKNAIMAKRLTRLGGQYSSRLKKVSAPFGELAKLSFKKAKATISALEDHYQKLKTESMAQHSVTEDVVKKLLDEGQKFVKEGRYGEAEKRFIEILSHDPKNVRAYESYGEMLVEKKDYEKARETFKFILKINPKDASVLTSLGEIELTEGDPEKAKDYFEKAIEKRPKNPKYLDFYVEASIRAEAPADARKGLKQLKEVNPDNQKLEEFSERIKKLVAKPIEK